MTVVLTGATGFIGRRLAAALRAAGFTVRGLTRDPARAALGQPDIAWYRAALDSHAPSEVWQGADLVIHAAHDTALRDPAQSYSLHVEGARRLFAAARAAGVPRILFVSSMSAHEQAESAYGRSKHAIEALLDPVRDLVIRPGFVVGPGGVYARLSRSIAALPVIPLFHWRNAAGSQPIQLIGVGDLCAGIVGAVQRGVTGRVVLASSDVLPVGDFYRIIAARSGSRHKPGLSLPGTLALPLLRLAERLGAHLPMTSENLLGLKALRSAEVTDDLIRVGLAPKSCREVLEQFDTTDAPVTASANPKENHA